METLQEEGFEDDDTMLHYIFYACKDIENKNIDTIQEKIQSLDLPFFEKLGEFYASSTRQSWDFLISPDSPWEKPEREDFFCEDGFFYEDDYRHHLKIYHVFKDQETRLKNKFFSQYKKIRI